MGHRGPRETDRQRLRETHPEREPKAGAPSRGQIRDWGGSVGAQGAPPELGCPGSPAVFLHVLPGRVSYLYVWLLQVSPVVYELLVAICGIQFPTGETRD